MNEQERHVRYLESNSADELAESKTYFEVIVLNAEEGSAESTQFNKFNFPSKQALTLFYDIGI